jgi:ABC-2 type transport system permease protein
MSAPATQPVKSARPVWKVSQLHVLKSEWIKLSSVRATMWTYLATVGALVGLGVVTCLVTVTEYKDGLLPPEPPLDPTGSSLTGVFMAQVAIAVLGVLCITGEYASGMVRATFAAVPKRLPVVIAKAIVLPLATFVIMLVSSFAAFFLGQLILKTEGLNATLSDPGALRAVVGCALYLSVMALAGLGLGLIIRSTAGAIGVLVVILFVFPIIASFLPANIQNVIVKWLPGTAVESIAQTAQQPNLLGPWQGFAVFCGYTLLALVIGAILVKKRDASPMIGG